MRSAVQSSFYCRGAPTEGLLQPGESSSLPAVGSLPGVRAQGGAWEDSSLAVGATAPSSRVKAEPGLWSGRPGPHHTLTPPEVSRPHLSRGDGKRSFMGQPLPTTPMAMKMGISWIVYTIVCGGENERPWEHRRPPALSREQGHSLRSAHAQAIRHFHADYRGPQDRGTALPSTPRSL